MILCGVPLRDPVFIFPLKNLFHILPIDEVGKWGYNPYQYNCK